MQWPPWSVCPSICLCSQLGEVGPTIPHCNPYLLTHWTLLQMQRLDLGDHAQANSWGHTEPAFTHSP